MKTISSYSIDGFSLTLSAIFEIAQGEEATLSKEALDRIDKASQFVEKLVSKGQAVYGVTTGFGSFSQKRIGRSDLKKLQLNLLRSHAAGCGLPLNEAAVRAMMLLRINVIAQGRSGTRKETIQLLTEMLNRGVHPVIPEQGSVGASGDLAPLAHLALVLVGEGEAFYKGKRLPGKKALLQAKLKPIALSPKEGISLINGTQFMTAIGVLEICRLTNLVKIADVAGALSLEGVRGTPKAFDSDLVTSRPYQGATASAANLSFLMQASSIVKSHANCSRVQDPYSFRCMPQVHGAVRDALHFAEKILSIEINATTDNPLLFPEKNKVVSGGNFHGQPVSQTLDFLSIATTTLGSISERRIDQMMNAARSGLPSYLTQQEGLNSGLALLQVTAAALVSENKTLSHPASVDTIPNWANVEDHVSMGAWAARKLRQIVNNTETILAIELCCATQALEFLLPLSPSPSLLAVYKLIRERIPPLTEDRVLYKDIEEVKSLISSEAILKAVEKAAKRKLR